jgi:hypothetical protein
MRGFPSSGSRLRRLAGAAVAISALLATPGLGSPPAGADTASEAEAPSTSSPLGVFFAPLDFTIQERVSMATDVGAVYVRSYPALLATWAGTCDECPMIREAGLRLILTVRNTGDILEPATAPADLDAYREAVASVADVYEPELIAVENEENAPMFYRGTADQYGAQLQVACQAAHSRGVPCANGGLQSKVVKYFVYQSYMDSRLTGKAASYAEAAFDEKQKRNLASPGGRQSIRRSAGQFQRFLDLFASSGIDYLNIHWYQGTGGTLKQSVRLLRRLTGFEVITNEIGQWDRDAAKTRELLNAAIDVGMPYIVWYGRSLVRWDGTLLATGRAYRSVAHSL